jgi:acetyltransferase-like isoleucine patch superfamily enzyme
VKIGKWCAIGHNVTILAVTHDTGISTGPEQLRPSRKGDVIIDDGVWIGSNVIITPGVHIGKMCVIGGNSVVTKDLPPYTICAGIPCKVLRKKEDEEIRIHEELIK